MQKAQSTASTHIPIPSVSGACKLFLEWLSYICCYRPWACPQLFCISRPTGSGLGFFCCNMKWGTYSSADHSAAEWSQPRGTNPLQGAGSCVLSSLAVNKHCTTWTWYACCLSSGISKHALVFSLGDTYLPFSLGCTHIIFYPGAKPDHLVKQYHFKFYFHPGGIFVQAVTSPCC